MGKVKPMKVETNRAPHSILLDDYTLASSGNSCVTSVADRTNVVLNDGDTSVNDDQNIPVISVTSINHPLENRLVEHRKTQTNDCKRSQLTSIVKSESLPTNITCDVRSTSGSAPSSMGSEIICRICHSEAEPEQPLISPCLCSGTLKFVHQDCLHHWIKSSDLRYCELCKFEFIMKVTTKPFSKWQNLEMSPVERRKIICSVTFHVIALTCVIWSLYVLIERTTEEINNGVLEWPFWTKLIVMAIGFVGGVVFMYVQCRMYVGLCRRWRAHNRTFVVKSVPSDVLTEAQKAARHRTAVANAAAAAVAAAIPPSPPGVVEPSPPGVLPSERGPEGLETVVICGTVPAETSSDVRIGPASGTSTCSITSTSSCVTSTATSTAVVVSDGLHPALIPQRLPQSQPTHWITSTIL